MTQVNNRMEAALLKLLTALDDLFASVDTYPYQKRALHPDYDLDAPIAEILEEDDIPFDGEPGIDHDEPDSAILDAADAASFPEDYMGS